MNSYKKTFWGSVVAFFIGTSCCWLGSLAVWLGGAAFIGIISSIIEDAQILILGVGIILLALSIWSYLKFIKKKPTE